MSDLADALDLSLEVGELVQTSGGHTSRTAEHMARMARALGASSGQPAISSLNVMMTVSDGHEHLTAVRQARHLGINFNMLSALRALVTDAEKHQLSADQVRSRILLIRSAPPIYPTWVVTLALGGSSAAFAALFGASTIGVLLTFAAGLSGAWTRNFLVGRHLKPFVSVTSAAFVAGIIVAGGSSVLNVGATAAPALAASTLFLVPGVPMLNGTADLMNAHYLNGLVRLAMSAVIISSAAVGLATAVTLAEALT